MRGVRLRLAASLVTLGTLVASSLYAVSHLKSADAPMQPSVVGSQAAARPAAGQFLAPSVERGPVGIITSTHAS